MAKRKNLEEYKRLFDKGLSNKEIVEKLGVTKQAVSYARSALERQAKKELVYLTAEAVKSDPILIETYIQTVENETKKFLNELWELGDKDPNVNAQMMSNAQMIANMALNAKVTSMTDPEFLKAVSMHNKSINDFLSELRQ